MEKALVLIVEDDMITAKSIEAMVTDYGMEVVGICKTGEQAIELAEQRTPDIVIMDIKLAGKMDGIQAAAALQDIETIPVIYLSDYTTRAIVRKAKETRPANYLSKPFTESDLMRAVEIAIYNANEQRARIDSDEEFVFVKDREQKTYSKLQYNNIIYVEADRSYCKIQTTDQLYTPAITMASVASQLSNERFVKIHRSYIVNFRQVSEFMGDAVIVSGYRLPVSDQHRTELMMRLKILH
jgi:DNA-binding LytR/AlgR family response regulator